MRTETQTPTPTEPMPNVVSRAAWLEARLELLAAEKELTHRRDMLNAQRRRLPMVELDEDYTFDSEAGRVRLLDLFQGRRQLIVYHFMFDPDDAPAGKTEPWTEGCSGCSFCADGVPHLAHLRARETAFAMVSRAPLGKILPFKRRMGWTMPWVSSFGTAFNYDFQVTIDPARGSTRWNYRDTTELQKAGKIPYTKGELPGLSVFYRSGERVFHSYSTYARGLEALLGAYHLLDLTPLGRGEGWGGMPDVHGLGLQWLRHHDRYDAADAPAPCCHAQGGGA